MHTPHTHIYTTRMRNNILKIKKKIKNEIIFLQNVSVQCA